MIDDVIQGSNLLVYSAFFLFFLGTQENLKKLKFPQEKIKKKKVPKIKQDHDEKFN